ncbi:MAG: hypothetical protein ACTSRU_20780 [Candidatus Hodarchaeales archaeon]
MNEEREMYHVNCEIVVWGNNRVDVLKKVLDDLEKLTTLEDIEITQNPDVISGYLVIEPLEKLSIEGKTFPGRVNNN